MDELNRLIHELREELGMDTPTMAMHKEANALLTENVRKFDIVWDAYVAVRDAIYADGAVTARVKAAQAEFERVCKEVAGV